MSSSLDAPNAVIPHFKDGEILNESMLYDLARLSLDVPRLISSNESGCLVKPGWIRDGQVGLEFAHETHLDGPSDQVAKVLRDTLGRSFPHITLTEPTAPVALAS